MVIKAAATGELAGVGRLGTAGKTTCNECNVRKQCLIPPDMRVLLNEYSKLSVHRDYENIATVAQQAEQSQD
jgi:hypothetical protein